jgi:uncharacterized protein (TIGR02001 family)
MYIISPKAAAAFIIAASPLFATAQVTANLSLTSNYKFRGQDQDMLARDGLAKDNAFKPAVQGGFDYAFGDSGFYLGNWNSSVGWLPGNSIEMDFYGGYKVSAGIFDLDFGALTYRYPGNTRGNTTELYIGATHSNEVFGSLTAKYSHTVSRDYFNFAGSGAGSGLDGRNTGYLNLAYSRPVSPRVTLKAALGYTRMSDDIQSLGYRNYVDFNIGGGYDLGSGLSLQAAVQGANRSAAYATPSEGGGGRTFSPNKGRLIVSLTKTL